MTVYDKFRFSERKLRIFCDMSSNETQNNSKGEIVIYQTEDGKTSVNVRLENDTVWLSQEMMASLFEKDRTDIGRHIRNIYKEGELSR